MGARSRRGSVVTRQKTRKRLRRPERTAAGTVRVNVEALAPNNSYGAPRFVERGYYVDEPFTCAGCGVAQVWTAWQQKWWYEVAKGFAYSTAKHCRACRRREQARRAEAKRVHLEGVARKRARKA
jgi:putative zinc ribbon protein